MTFDTDILAWQVILTESMSRSQVKVMDQSSRSQEQKCLFSARTESENRKKQRWRTALFRTSNIETVKTCQLQFAFDLLSVIIEKRIKNYLQTVSIKLITHIPVTAMLEMFKFTSTYMQIVSAVCSVFIFVVKW